MHQGDRDINSIIYSPPTARSVAEELQQEIKNFVPGEEILLFQTIDCLSYKMLFVDEIKDKVILIIIVNDLAELLEVFECHELLACRNIIFILPHNDYQLATKASEVNPRKITFYNQEYSEVIEEILSFRNIV